jgi:hypothetical protein
VKLLSEISPLPASVVRKLQIATARIAAIRRGEKFQPWRSSGSTATNRSWPIHFLSIITILLSNKFCGLRCPSPWLALYELRLYI